MAPSKLRKAIGAVKDQTRISLVKVSGSSNTLSELEVAIVKATRHDEHPAEGKHVREILSRTCYSHQYVTACVNFIARRLNKTKNWTVALKTLVLVHRLLVDGDPGYQQEVFFATRRGTRLLNMSDFRDKSMSDSWDFSAFVRTFALYLDERLEFGMQGKRDRRRFGVGDVFDEEEDKVAAPSSTVSSLRGTPMREMNIENIIARTQHLQKLLDRFLACRPTGAAKNNRIVAVALYPVVKESYQMYYDILDIMNIMVDRFTEVEVPECVKILETFIRISKQFDELDVFYGWCRSVRIVRSSDYPEIDKGIKKKLDVMDEFIRERSALASRTKKSSDFEQPKEEQLELNDSNDDNNPPNSSSVVDKEETIVKEDDDDDDDDVKNKTALVVIEEKEVVDFLDLKNELADNREELALVLFDGLTTTDATSGETKWETFCDEPADWETALVVSASNLQTQKLSLGGGLDTFVLDSMYQQNHYQQQASSMIARGSASSMAFPPVGSYSNRQGLLALPAPQLAERGSSGSDQDPFSASLAVAPPAYVEMSDMERKQGYLIQEQAMWNQYAKNGMQGQVGLLPNHNPNHNYHVNGGNYYNYNYYQQQQHRYY